MYISKKDRNLIKNRFSGKCAYSGTDLKDDWQIDHVKPLVRNWWTNTATNPDEHCTENMFPVQKILNHYKGSLDLESFRNWLLGGLHDRLRKLPKNSKSAKTIKRKAYLLEVASFFGISEDKPFGGKFYFETINQKHLNI